MIHMVNKEHIHIGKDSEINKEGHLTAHPGAGIFIGDNVNIGPYVVINTGDHIYEDLHTLIKNQGHKTQTIHIGNDVWIGAHVTILRGSHIPHGCVIGACSLVTRHSFLEPFGVYVGNPLRKIGERK